MPNNKIHNNEHNDRARSLRKNMTEQERKLWFRYLRNYSPKFRRQVTLGYYIADFYCADAKLVIELDGSQHYTDEGESYDKTRDEYLRSLGLTVLRYSNYDIEFNFRNVCEDIFYHVDGEKN